MSNIYRKMALQAINNVLTNCDDNDNISVLIDTAYPFASRHDFLLRIWNEEKSKALALLPQFNQQITPSHEQMPLWS